MLKALEAILLAFANVVFTFYWTPYLHESKKWQIVIFVVLLIFFYYVILSEHNRMLKWFKNEVLRYFIPKIGILNGQIHSNRDYACKYVWAGVRPLQWKLGLITKLTRTAPPFLKFILQCAPNLLVKEIRATEINDSFFMIINPFGDNYPEEDTELYVTFSKIRRFVENGGIFLVTGGAFYWQQNTSKTLEPEQTIVKQYIKEEGVVQYLKDTLLCIKFGINTTGDGPEENTLRKFYQTETDKNQLGDLTPFLDNAEFTRFRAITVSSSCNFLPIVRERDREYLPIALVKNGHGFLLHLGMHIVKDDSPEFNLATEVIIRLIKSNERP